MLILLLVGSLGVMSIASLAMLLDVLSCNEKGADGNFKLLLASSLWLAVFTGWRVFG